MTNFHIKDDYKPLIQYIHKKDRCSSSFRRCFSRIIRKIAMPVYNATHKFSVEHHVQMWSRGMETGPKRDHQGEGKAYLMKKRPKDFGLFCQAK